MDRHLNQVEDVDTGSTAKPPAETDSSESVEWRDISVDTPGRPDSGSDRLSEPEAAGDGTTRRDSAGDHVEDRIRAYAGEPLTIETGEVTATLLGVPRVRVDDLVYAHQHEGMQGTTRACAMFDIENTGSGPVHWTSRRTKFIGSDGYTYRHAHVSLDPSQLGPGCYPKQVEIEPGCRARVITPVEQLPSTVDVANVIHTVSLNGRLGTQRLTFNLE